MNGWLFLAGFSFIYFSLALSHWWAWKYTAKMPGMGDWTLGFAGVGLGQIMAVIYALFRIYPVAAAGYILEAIGLVFVVRGCNTFILRRRGVKIEIALAGFGILASALFSAVFPSLILRLLFGNLAFAGLQLSAAIVFIRYQDPTLKPSLVFIPICFVAVGLVELVHAVIVAVSGDVALYFRTKPLFLVLVQFAYTGLMLTTLHLSYARFQAALSERVAERDTLLKEMHHRTKNNLAIVGSLVSLESSAFSDLDVRKAFARVGSRLRAVSLLHERMQDSNSSRFIHADEYLNQILELARLDVKSPIGRVETHGSIEQVELDSKIALPLGIIVNELATNAIKHAFPGDRGGTLSVSFKRADGCYELVVEDDGVGISSDRREGTLGIGLVRALSEQVCGDLTYEPREPGTRYRLVFPKSDVDCAGKRA